MLKYINGKVMQFYSQDPQFYPSSLHAEEWNSVYKYADTGRFLLTPDCYRELYFVVSVASIYCS